MERSVHKNFNFMRLNFVDLSKEIFKNVQAIYEFLFSVD